MLTDMHVSGVRVLVIALSYGSPLNHSELTMETKCRSVKVRRIFCPHCGERVIKYAFIVTKTSSLITTPRTTRKLGLKMLEHPDAPLVQIAAMNPIELWEKDVM